MVAGPTLRRLTGWSAPALLAALVAAGPAARAGEEGAAQESFIHVYTAQWSRTRFNQIVRMEVDPDHSHLAAIGYGRTVTDWGRHARLEWEVQAAKHWGLQDHPEVNAIVAVRWHGFPWDPVLRNTIALGTGASYAFDVPATEEQGSDTSTRLLQHLMLDLSAARAEWGDWSLFLRVHHRSGVFGLVADSGSSNFVGFGVRRHF